jgi:sugar transferase (PEP-CTERM/EpsH1 system associated)
VMQSLATPRGASITVTALSASTPTCSMRPRVLVIAHRTPFPPDKGDRIRTYNIIRYLAARASVDVVALADEEPGAAIVAGLRAQADHVELVRCDSPLRWWRAAVSGVGGRSATEGLFHSPELRRRIGELAKARRYDLVLATCSSMAQYVDRKTFGSASVLIDLIDVDSEKWSDYANTASGWKRWAYALEARRVRQLEAALAERCHKIAVTTSAEADCYRAIQPAGDVVAIPNGVDYNYFHPADVEESPASCVFVGALDYKPNIDGMIWFCRRVWPTIRARRSDATLSIVGRRPVGVVQELALIPGVRVVADVPDVRPHLWGAQVAIAPLQIARGVQNKVLEALSAGRAVVASPQAILGLGVQVGRDLLAAEQIDEWTTALMQLWSNASERRKLGAAGRAFVMEQHCWDRCLQPIADLIRPQNDGDGAR